MLLSLCLSLDLSFYVSISHFVCVSLSYYICNVAIKDMSGLLRPLEAGPLLAGMQLRLVYVHTLSTYLFRSTLIEPYTALLFNQLNGFYSVELFSVFCSISFFDPPMIFRNSNLFNYS